MLWKCKHLLAAIWLYLNQPLSRCSAITVWQPRRFWYLYQIQLFEICWYMNAQESHSNSP
ncbi:MAG: hypothetical protein ACRC6M_17955 [Microcystaceae cyanobacterium]